MSDDTVQDMSNRLTAELLSDLHPVLSELRRREVGDLTLLLEASLGYAHVVFVDEREGAGGLAEPRPPIPDGLGGYK